MGKLALSPGRFPLVLLGAALCCALASASSVVAQSGTAAGTPRPPEEIGVSAGGSGVLIESDGSLSRYSLRARADGADVQIRRSTDFGRTWTQPATLAGIKTPYGASLHTLRSRSGTLHGFFARLRGEGRNPAVDRFIDLWHLRSQDNGKTWTEPSRIFEGYCGSFQQVVELRSGTLVLPFARWIPNRPSAPPTGSNVTTVVYSRDGGATWSVSPAELTAPCAAGFNGNNYGAIEPVILELKDGRVWMLIRTQAGRLYEAFSRDGISWSSAQPSRFVSSTSPAFLLRLKDGRLAVFWNNCEMPERVDGQGVYGGRDALHAAISSDEGKTFVGYREVYRDPYRSIDPPRSGDRGTAYPWAAVGADGTILLISGQGERRRRMLRVDPAWITAGTAASSFENGLEDWCVYKPYGPARGFWRARHAGPALQPDPGGSGKSVLVLGRPAGQDADAAVWNFPGGSTGVLRIRLRVPAGSEGVAISLADHFLDPTDTRWADRSRYQLRLGGSGGVALPADGAWHEVKLSWQSGEREARVSLDGSEIRRLEPSGNGAEALSYLHLRSLAENSGSAGAQIAAVSVDVKR